MTCRPRHLDVLERKRRDRGAVQLTRLTPHRHRLGGDAAVVPYRRSRLTWLLEVDWAGHRRHLHHPHSACLHWTSPRTKSYNRGPRPSSHLHQSNCQKSRTSRTLGCASDDADVSESRSLWTPGGVALRWFHPGPRRWTERRPRSLRLVLPLIGSSAQSSSAATSDAGIAPT